MPPKIDKSHGFMQSIIKNQVLRDEYDKQQKLLTVSKEAEMQNDKQCSEKQDSHHGQKRNRTPRRAAVQLYVPPHAKDRSQSKKEDKPSSKDSPEPSKRLNNDINDTKDPKRTRRSASYKKESDVERILFKFEYEEDSGDVRTLYVKEDDNAEDLAETFGNQLGLTKSLKKALHHKLREEIKNCLSST